MPSETKMQFLYSWYRENIICFYENIQTLQAYQKPTLLETAQ